MSGSWRLFLRGAIALSLTIGGASLASAQPISDLEGDLGIGTLDPHPSAILDITSTGQGILVPRMTTAQRDAIPFPADGLIIFNTEAGALQVWSDASGAFQWDEIMTTGSNKAWRTEGNIDLIDGTDNFLGTLDATPIRFVTNNAEQMQLSTAGDLGIGTAPTVGRLHVEGGSSGNAVFANTSLGSGVWGITDDISGAGVIGDNTFGEAVVGRNRGGSGVGAVVGRNDSSGYGVRGFNTEDGIGVLGQAGVSGGTGNAGRFENLNAGNVSTALEVESNGIGSGLSVELTNASNGGRGIDVTQSGVGPGVFATSAGGNAVWGITSSISAAGVIGDNTFGEAVVGRNRGGNGVGAVVGRNDSSGYGVRGFNTKDGVGVIGQAGISGGTGQAGRFENVNAANVNTTVAVATNGIGNGISVNLSNASNGGRGIDVTQSGVGPGVFATSAGGNAVWGITSSISAAGVIGDNTFGEAVVGRNRGGNGVGAVVGRNDSSGYGVRGFNTKDGVGVIGQAGISGGTGQAGRFENVNAANVNTTVAVATNGIGSGLSVNLSNASNGGRGIDVTQSGVGPGVFATSAGGNAVWGITSSISAAGVIGDNTFGEAVVGRNRGGNGVGAVVGRNDSSGYGVRGFNTKDGVGVIGQAGISGGTGQAGRFENVNAANVNTTVAVATNGIGNGISVSLSNASNGGRGIDVTQSGVGPGVFATSAGGNAVWGITSSISAAGVIGDNTFGEAVVGRNRGGNGVGAVVGRNDSSGYGVRGFNTKNGYGVLGQAGISGGTGTAGRFENVNAANTSDALQVVTNSAGNAARFTGNVVVNGNLTVSGTVAKGGGTFMIDHPLDPENKILYHSFVESPEMKNIYDGTVKLDAKGEAWVEMPEWFEALNTDFRYQLTAVGGSAPGLHVAQEIADRRFRIAGGTPGIKVSWQVTGVRQDAYARTHPIEVEVEKTADQRGTYIHPEAYGVKARAIEMTTTSAEIAPLSSSVSSSSAAQLSPADAELRVAAPEKASVPQLSSTSGISSTNAAAVSVSEKTAPTTPVATTVSSANAAAAAPVSVSEKAAVTVPAATTVSSANAAAISTSEKPAVKAATQATGLQSAAPVSNESRLAPLKESVSAPRN